MSKKKFESLSNNNDEFVSFSASRRFKRFKIKLISHIDILNNENDKSFSPLNESQFLIKPIDFGRDDLIIAKSNLK